MSDRKPGLIRRFFGAIWNTVNFARRLVFNLIFLAIVVAIFAGLMARTPVLQSGTALVLDLQGDIVEQYSVDASQRAIGRITGNATEEIQLRDILRTIDAAASDANIGHIVLIPDDMGQAGPSTVREIGQALDRFRASGKPVTTVANNLGQTQYALAVHSDRILLDPEGSVEMTGYSSYRNYYKELLDKLGVDVHLIKVGTYKSAAEPYVRTEASDASKEADLQWMGALWQEYLADVAAQRKLDPAKISDDIANYGDRVIAVQGDLATLALNQKLVDQLATREQARDWLREQGVPADGDSFRQVDWTRYAAQLPPANPLATHRVAVVVAEGEILPGEQAPGTIGGRSTAQLLRQAREDDSVNAIVLRVSSPGGDSNASELIRREVVQAQQAGKPVVISMGDYAASGGYWIAMNGDEIWAQPTSITGSIGIYALLATIPETLAKLGINVDGIATTPLAAAMDLRRPLSPVLETVITQSIQRGYRQFIGLVAQARKKTPEQIDAIAQGQVWIGTQAKQRGLVDKLGGLEDAIAAAAERANLGDDYAVRYVERPMSTWETLALRLSNSEAAVAFGKQFALPMLPSGLIDSSDLRDARLLLDSLGRKTFASYAHCFCTIR